MEREHEELHARIQEGDLESVERHLQDANPGLALCFEGISALKRSFVCKQVDVSTLLIRFGVTFKDDAEGEDLDISEDDVDLINIRFWYFNRDVEESCIYKLMVYSKLSFQGDKRCNDALLCMYQELFQSECIRYLMKVLEKETPHIVYDFGSKNIDRIYFEAETGLSGITLPSTNSIYIGAEELMSEKAEERAKVKGVVAEEFCHLALQYLFENGSKPYKVKEENSGKVRAYQDLVSSLESDAKNEGILPQMIQDLFFGGVYERDVFECELIARVPHLMGIYGEKKVRETFKYSTNLSQLIKFYDDHIIPACKSFTNPLYYSRPMSELQALHREKGYISANEKNCVTHRDDADFFEGYLAVFGGIKVLYTNITKLCAIQMYHEFKERITYHVDKVCLFFTLSTFEEIKDRLKQYKSELIEYLILIVENVQAESVRKAVDSYVGGDENPKVIIISQSDCVKYDGIRYKWNDVPFEFKELFLERSFHFKGKKHFFKDHFKVEDLNKIFEYDIATFQNLTHSGAVLQINEGPGLFSQHYHHETYMKRDFRAMAVDKKIFRDSQRGNFSVIISGLKMGELKVFPFDEGKAQWLQRSDDEIQSDKSIFIINEEISLKEFEKRFWSKKCVCLHRDENEFYLRNTDSCGDGFSRYLKQKTLSEEEILNVLKRRRTLIISDNAGYGKSTVISSLIDHLKSSRSWNWRMNFNQFSGNRRDPLSLSCIEDKRDDEEILNHLFLTLGLKNGLERHLFKRFSEEGHCFIFFDGFDEIPSKYFRYALKLLSTVRRRTAANVIVTTRKHHQEELEQLLNTFSHQLIPLSKEEQVKYLEKLWKTNLKYPFGKRTSQNDKEKVVRKIRQIAMQSEKGKTELDKELRELVHALKEIELEKDLGIMRRKIEDLKLSKLALSVIEETSLDNDTVEFMGIPLHLFMVGIIYFDNNFKVKIGSGFHRIYSEFIEGKILIYVEDKGGLLQDGWIKEYVIRKLRKRAYMLHMELANELTEYEKLDGDMKDLCLALGIVCRKGAQIDFLHYTFAEFFKAESIRLSMKKKVLHEVLSHDKYVVVRMFLASSLEEKKFENLTEDFFEDLEFLFPVLKEFVLEFENILGIYGRNSYLANVIGIVKCLLESFEETLDSDSFNDFVQIFEYELLSYKNCYIVGGCFTVKMFKLLFKRNFYFQTIFGVVAYYTNPEEVIEVLNECILTSGEFDRKCSKAEVLLEMFKLKDSKGNGLFSWAIYNFRKEIYVKILEFLMDALGKERLITGIIQSEEYEKALNGFIDKLYLSESFGMIKAFHSVFGNESEIFFDKNAKFKILEKSLEAEEELENKFEEAIEVFKECFGLENLREFLLSGDSLNDYLSHRLVYERKDLNKNLSVVENILCDQTKMRRFLMFENRFSWTAFHLAARISCENFGEILQFCYEHFEQKEIEEMLLSVFSGRQNLLQIVFQYNFQETVIEKLNFIKSYFAEKELFKKLLKSKNGYSSNIFHLVAMNLDKINLYFLDSHLNRSEINDLLVERNKRGRTCLHYGANSDCQSLPILLEYSLEILSDDERKLEELILAEDEDGNTFFHSLVEKYSVKFGEECVIEVIKSVKEKVSDDIFKKLLRIRNKNGKTCLQVRGKQFFFSRSNKIVEFFGSILEENVFEELTQKNMCKLQ